MEDKIKHIKGLLRCLNEEVECGECFENKSKMEAIYNIADELKDELEPNYWFWIKQDKQNK